jgi:hypothetical protein
VRTLEARGDTFVIDPAQVPSQVAEHKTAQATDETLPRSVFGTQLRLHSVFQFNNHGASSNWQPGTCPDKRMLAQPTVKKK